MPKSAFRNIFDAAMHMLNTYMALPSNSIRRQLGKHVDGKLSACLR